MMSLDFVQSDICPYRSPGVWAAPGGPHPRRVFILGVTQLTFSSSLPTAFRPRGGGITGEGPALNPGGHRQDRNMAPASI